MLEITTVREEVRMCGWRKPGALYLVAEGLESECGKLPLALGNCPTCGYGIKFSRAWTWIQPAELASQVECDPDKRGRDSCGPCPLSKEEASQRVRDGLLWIGKEHYPTVEDYRNEANRLGVSRRIKGVPRGFVPGDTWVWLAHLEAVPTFDGWLPGAFEVFRPRAVQYIVKEDDTDDDLQKLMDRGITPVRVEKVGEQLEMA